MNTGDIHVSEVKAIAWIRLANLVETCYRAFGTRVLSKFLNDDPRLTFDLFTQKSTWVPHGFVWENA